MIQESSKDPYHAMKIRIENFGESDLRRFANSISEVVRVSNNKKRETIKNLILSE